MSLSAGTHLGPFEILSQIGAGGMGEVYRARDTRLGREVAIKVLPAGVSSEPERLKRFENEARSASSLNHPNIVTIHDIGESRGASFIAMELVSGQTVRELLAEGALPTRRLLVIAAQVADGLARAHGAGIVHRDLKPENVMVTKDGLVKILDFGLAKLASARSDSGEESQFPTEAGTSPGVVMGTVGYMSPEQALGKALDFRSDQFSFGSILYEMATGKRAFLRESAPETLTAIIREEPEPMGNLSPLTPAPLRWIVERCLAKDPDDRYASTRDLARDVAAVRERFLEASPRARSARPAGLPAQRTGFVGRERERAAARELLLRGDVRLVTLTGPGGIGKTRLGLRIGSELHEEFPGGVYFVSLEQVADPGLIPATIAQTLVAREGGSQPPLETLMEYLRDPLLKPTLLLLDSFEHLMPAASIVADLVAAGPCLKILVTSRSPLHVYGEHELPVPPLALPDARGPAGVEELSRNEAVALFVQRSAAVKPDFALTRERAADVAEICRRLDGLPLAIELAAARVKLLSPAAMRARLESRLQLLTGGARDLPARQQTLRGAIDWSHELLNEAEQKLFRRLSVFAGGCTLEAAEAVCDAMSDLGMDVLDGMASMVDKSLLQQVEPARGESRFLMLETIREYARERLASSGDEPMARRAHAAYCLVLAEEEGSEAGASEAAARLDRFESEHDNFRAALDWLSETGNAEWGLRLGAALFRFWETREHLAEGRNRLAKLLELTGAAARNKARSRALFAAGVLAGAQADYVRAQELLDECLSIDRELGDRWSAAVVLNALAVHALDRGKAATARSLSEESLASWRELGDRAAVARSLSNLANVATAQGEHARAASLYEESLSIFSELGDRAGVAWALDHLGDVAREQGRFADARAFYERSLAAFRELGDRWGIAAVLADLGNLARDRGDHAGAYSLHTESLRIFQELEHRRGIARLLECFACSAAAEGGPERALRLAGAAAALRKAVGSPLPRADQARLDERLAPVRAALSDTDGAAAWMEGWGMPVEKAIESALSAGPA